MVCPSCGIQHSDEPGQCSNCGYKFRWGYAFNDPKKMTFIDTFDGAKPRFLNRGKSAAQY